MTTVVFRINEYGSDIVIFNQNGVQVISYADYAHQLQFDQFTAWAIANGAPANNVLMTLGGGNVTYFANTTIVVPYANLPTSPVNLQAAYNVVVS